jgi:hypothetical protein
VAVGPHIPIAKFNLHDVQAARAMQPKDQMMPVTPDDNAKKSK